MSERSSGGASRESRPLRDTDHAAVLKTRIESRTASIAIVGMGYVGLPLAKAALDAGLSVIGIDIDAERVRKLNDGQSHVRHVSSGLIAEAVAARRLCATTDFVAIAEADAVVICVPTPLTRNREPDLTFIVRTAKAILPHLRRGHLVVLESTTYPGTTSDVLKPILEGGGLRSGTDEGRRSSVGGFGRECVAPVASTNEGWRRRRSPCRMRQGGSLSRRCAPAVQSAICPRSGRAERRLHDRWYEPVARVSQFVLPKMEIPS
jgi:hypothetical protein